MSMTDVHDVFDHDLEIDRAVFYQSRLVAQITLRYG